MIDWVLAERLATLIAGRGTAPPPASAAVLASTAADAQRRVVDYTGLEPSRPLPAPEAIERREWVAANLGTMRRMLDPVLTRADERLRARRRPGGGRGGRGRRGSGRSLGPATASLAVSAAVTLEVAVVVGYLAQRVLGQYELVLLDETQSHPPRLLFVLPNLGAAVQAMDAPEDEFLTWVTLHEVTHAVQFSGVPWLQGYLAGLLATLLRSAELRMDDTRGGLRLPSRAQLARSLRAARSGDVIGIFASPGEQETLDRVQAAMAVVEGHAEHVMDAVAPELLPSLPRLRSALDRRRQTQKGLSRALGKLLGLELKLRQYEQGKFFCDAIVQAAGPQALREVFSSPEALPTLAELGDPLQWVARMGLAAQLPRPLDAA